jgi:hypothetical protein
MIRFSTPTLPVRPYWSQITEVYYRDIQPQYVDVNPITIWGWLEQEYGAYRNNPWAQPFDQDWIRFEQESSMTAFLLRFT